MVRYCVYSHGRGLDKCGHGSLQRLVPQRWQHMVPLVGHTHPGASHDHRQWWALVDLPFWYAEIYADLDQFRSKLKFKSSSALPPPPPG